MTVKNDNITSINKEIDEGEELRIRVLLSSLKDKKTKPSVKKDIIADLLDSQAALSSNTARAVMLEVHNLFFNQDTPRSVVVKISAILKKFRNAKRSTGGISEGDLSGDKNLIEVEDSDF